MSDDALYLLFQSLGAQVMEGRLDPTGTVSILMSETLKFRDKLKSETGVVLTVDDTRKALDGLDLLLHDKELPAALTSEQRMLAQIWFDRLTLFKKR